MPLTGVTQQNLQPIIDALGAHAQQSNVRTGAQVSLDAQGLVAQSSRDFNNLILPQITRAGENAGASGGALAALLTQNAASAQAAKVSQLQANQLSINDQLHVQDAANQGQQLESLLNTVQTANTAAGHDQAAFDRLQAQLTAQATQAGADRANQLAIAQGGQATQLQIAQGNNATTIAEGGANRTSKATLQAADLAAQAKRLLDAQAFTGQQNAADRTATAANATQAQAATLAQIQAKLQAQATQGNLDRTAHSADIQNQLANQLQISQADIANQQALQQNALAQQAIQAQADRDLKAKLTKMGLDSQTINNILALNNASNINAANNANALQISQGNNAAANSRQASMNATIQAATIAAKPSGYRRGPAQ